MGVPIVSGFVLSHGSRSIRIAGVNVGAKSVKWSGSIDGEKMVYGTSLTPQGRTAGVFKPESVEVEIYRRDTPILLAALMSASLGRGVLMASVPIIIGASELPVGMPQFDTISGCRFSKIEDASTEGGDPILTKLTGTFMSILYAGFPLVFELPSL